MAVGQYVEIVQTGHVTETHGDIPVANVFHYQCFAPVVTMTEQDVADAFYALVNAAWALALPGEYLTDDLTCRVLDDSDNRPGSATTPLANGGVTGGAFPSHLAVHVKFLGTKRKRSSVGGKFIGPVALAHVTSSQQHLNATGIGVYQDLVDQLNLTFTDSNSNVWTPCVLSRQNSQLVNPTTIVMDSLLAPTDGAILKTRLSAINRRGKKVK